MARNVGASEIVIPDVLYEANDTLAQAQAFARYVQPEYQYMFVLQGKTPEEVMFCLRALDNGNMFSYVTTIGIPRHFYTINKWFRITLTKFIIEENFDLKFDIHFLGASSWMSEVFELSEMVKGREGFRSIDTSLPIYMGLENLHLDAATEYIRRPGDFFTRTDDNPDVINENIEMYLKWADYETTSS